MDLIQEKKINIGIMGGSFNPIHMGHLFLAEQARVCFQLDSVIFLPTGLPGYPKEEMPVSPKHRIEMTSLAINPNPFFFLSRYEAENTQPSYTINSLRAFRKIYSPDKYELYFITGADAVIDIFNWKESEELLSLAQFIAGSRPHFSFSEFHKSIADWPEARSKIHIMQMPLLEISSRLIRDYIRQGKSIRYLVTTPVEEYVRKYGLYSQERRFDLLHDTND